MQIELLKVTGQATASAAGTVVCELEPGYRYHSLLLGLTLPTGTQVMTVNYPSDMALLINGTSQMQITPNNLDLINIINSPAAFKRIASVSGADAAATPGGYAAYSPATTEAYLQRFFSEPWNTPETRQYTALDLTVNDNGFIQVPFASVAVAPVVSFLALVEPIAAVLASGRTINRENNRPTLVKITNGSSTPGAITHNITGINKTFSRADAIQHIRLKDADQAITAVEIKVNDKSIFKRTKRQNDAELYAQNMAPVTGYFDIVPNSTGAAGDAWVWTPNDKVNIGLTFASAAATAVAYHVQRFGQAD